MTSELTMKQNKAAMKYVECGDKSEAYRYAYNTENMKPASVNRKAKDLFDNVKIRARVEELQLKHRERHNVTVDRLTEELDVAYNLAIKNKNPSAAVAATMGKAKLHGLLIEKRQIENVDKHQDVRRYTDAELENKLAEAEKGKGEPLLHVVKPTIQ